jgi:quercetin dioxygenase-like cupin family protein
MNTADNAKTALPSGKALTLDGMIDYAPGAVVSRTLIKQTGGTVTLFAFDAGQGLSEHTAPFDALVTILDGSADITIGGEPVHAAAGQSVLMPAGIPHALHSAVQFKMQLVMIREILATIQ